MFKGSAALAENKLLLLYIFNQINMPMSNSHITQIVLENNVLNYFELQQYLSELLDAGLLQNLADEGKTLLNITEKGSNSLELFNSRIHEKKKLTIDHYLEANINKIKKEISVISEYVLEGNSPMVRLALKDNADLLIEIKIPAENNSVVQELSHHWKENYIELYDNIIALLNGKKENL